MRKLREKNKKINSRIEKDVPILHLKGILSSEKRRGIKFRGLEKIWNWLKKLF